MSQKLIGVAVRGDNASELVNTIEQAERQGIHAAWMTTGGARLDSITVFAAAAQRTERMHLAPFGRTFYRRWDHDVITARRVRHPKRIPHNRLGFPLPSA